MKAPPNRATPQARQELGLPVRPFLYTIDQIATLTNISEDALRRDHLHYVPRSVGFRPKNMMETRNIAPEGQRPDWRVAEAELIRWLRVMGFKVYDRAWVTR